VVTRKGPGAPCPRADHWSRRLADSWLRLSAPPTGPARSKAPTPAGCAGKTENAAEPTQQVQSIRCHWRATENCRCRHEAVRRDCLRTLYGRSMRTQKRPHPIPTQGPASAPRPRAGDQGEIGVLGAFGVHRSHRRPVTVIGAGLETGPQRSLVSICSRADQGRIGVLVMGRFWLRRPAAMPASARHPDLCGKSMIEVSSSARTCKRGVGALDVTDGDRMADIGLGRVRGRWLGARATPPRTFGPTARAGGPPLLTNILRKPSHLAATGGPSPRPGNCSRYRPRRYNLVGRSKPGRRCRRLPIVAAGQPRARPADIDADRAVAAVDLHCRQVVGPSPWLLPRRTRP